MKETKPFLRKPGGMYYFRYRDERKHRMQKCTNTRDFEQACLVMKAFLSKVKEPDIPTFLDELRRYQSIETNPKYRESQIDGSHYSRKYSQAVTYKAKKIESICKARCPEILLLKLDQFTRRDARKITEAIVEDMGHCRTAQICQQVVKGVFSMAFQDGIIQTSPTAGQKVIRYEEHHRYAIPNEWIAWVINNPNLFLSSESWAFFTVAATTGMRRSEILALSTEQIKGNTLVINRNMKDLGRDSEIGLPKWDLVRTIPLSQITLNAIHSLSPNINGRLFYHNACWVQQIFDNLKATLNGVDFAHKDIWQDLTAHVLRHSLNTNLIVSGIDSNKVAEYLGWQHQGVLLDMQRRYTHFVAKHLNVVSQEIDNLYSYQEGMLEAL